MIVPMAKTYITACHSDRHRLLDAIADLGVVHLSPVSPSLAVPDEQTLDRIQVLRRALQILEGVTPDEKGDSSHLCEASSGASRQMGTSGDFDSAQEVLAIVRRRAGYEHHLTELYHELRQLDMWGDFELEKIEQLSAAGIDLHFCSVPVGQVQDVRADCVEVVGQLPGRRSLVAAVSRKQDAEFPDGAVRLSLPARDAPSIRAEAAQIDATIKSDRNRLGQLVHQADSMRVELERLEQQAAETVAMRGAEANGDLFAVQGWIPEERASALAGDLAEAGIPTAVRVMKVSANEEPPTWLRSPNWTRPIEGLFSMMGTVAGYREFDVAVPFLLALPIFTAILISDGGYGAVLMLALTLGYRPATRVLGTRFTQLLIVVAVVTLLWGVVCATFFGVTLYRPLIPVNLSAQSRLMMMKICFAMGALHLSMAQLWQAIRIYPSWRLLNRVGWAIFIWGMFGVVQMFVLRTPLGWNTPWPYFLLIGAVLAILFLRPSRNPFRMIAWGIAAFPLSMMSAFSDVISYVRLMAVGLASSVLAVSFNELARGAEFWPLTVLILVLGHSLNMGLAMIAMFAHGVRLNMLEFCNNLGMKWTGYRYRPYLNRMTRSNHHGNGAIEF
jgi:V/A-type H+-transporting ATPase subunit I